MLLRSSSTPILNSWIPGRDASPESDSVTTPVAKARPVSVPAPLNASSPGYDSSRVSSFKISRTLSETDLRDLAFPPSIPRAKLRTLKSLPSSAPVDEECEEKGLDSGDSLARLFSSSGLDELVESGEGCFAEAKSELPPLLESGAGFGGGDGWISGGQGGSGSGGEGDGDGWGFSDSNSGHGSTDAYYQRMIEANPGNALLLTNYAKYLKEVRGDLTKSEEYCARAILVNPGDGDVLSLYGDLIWETQRDAQRAESYFDQAVQAEPDNCYVMASYARFLWDAEEEEEEEEEEGQATTQSAPVFRGAVAHHHPLAAAS